MTDDEIMQYLQAIKPVYSKSLNAQISQIDDKLGEIGAERIQLHRGLKASPPVTPVDQATWDMELERQEAIQQQMDNLDSETQKLRCHRHFARYVAEKEGCRQEFLKLKEMPRREIGDIQQQAQLMNILDNRCLQLAEVYRLLKSKGLAGEYYLSCGEIADLRGSWEDAIDAIELSFDEEPTAESDDVHVEQNAGVESANPKVQSSAPSTSDHEKMKAFDPLPISGIARIFPLDKDEDVNLKTWKTLASRASRNELMGSRVTTGKGHAQSTFDPLLVGDWLVKKGKSSRDRVNRRLASNLPDRSKELRDLFLP